MVIEFLEKFLETNITKLQGFLILLVLVGLVLALIFFNFIWFNDKLKLAKFKFLTLNHLEFLYKLQKRKLIKILIFLNLLFLLISYCLIVLIIKHLNFELVFLYDILKIGFIICVILEVITILISFLLLFLNWIELKSNSITTSKYLKINNKIIRMMQKISYLLIIMSLLLELFKSLIFN